MPYIKQEDRTTIRLTGTFSLREVADILGYSLNNGGELQYVIATMIQAFLEDKGLNYQNCQDIMGALQGANTEFYRMVVAPYEDEKIIENGAVYNIKNMKRGSY